MAESGWRGWATDFGPFLTLGIQLAIAVVAFFFLGRWLDGALGTAPWLMIGGLFVGIVGGLAQFLRTASALGKKEDEEARKERTLRDH
jgi:ATP synthase protein I